MDKNGREEGRRDTGFRERERNFHSFIPYPLTQEEKYTLEMNGKQLPKKTSGFEVLEHFYRYFRACSVSRAVPKVAMVKSVTNGSTVLEIIELFAREEIVDIILVDGEEDESMYGVWTFNDVITAVLYGNGSKLRDGIFSWSAKKFREKVLNDKNQALKSLYGKPRTREQSRTNSGDVSYPESEESEEEEDRNFLSIPRSRPRAVSDSSTTKPPRPTFGGGDVISIGRSYGKEHRINNDLDTPPTNEVSDEELTRSDSSGSVGTRKKVYLPRGTMSKVVAIRHSGTLWQAILVMFKFQIHRLVVVSDQENPIYMLTAGQILKELIRESDITAGPYLEEIENLNFENKDLRMCRYDTSVLEVLHNMHSLGNCLVSVVNNKKDRHVVDILTKADVLNFIQFLVTSQKPDESLLMEKHDVAYLLKLREKRYLRTDEEVKKIRERQGSKLHHEDLDEKRPVYKFGDLRTDGSSRISANIERWSVNGGTSFGECLKRMLGNQMNRLVLLEERTMKLLGTISPMDVFELLLRHFHEDFVHRKFSLAGIPFLKRKN